MRTTLDIEADVLAAAKELTHRQGTSPRQMVARLLRAALSGQPTAGGAPSPPPAEAVSALRPVLAQAGQLVTNDQIDQLRDEGERGSARAAGIGAL